MKTYRSNLATGALGALALSLAACGPDDQYSAALPLANPAFQPGWSMNDLAGIDPAFLDGGQLAYPEALPMQTSWDGDYGYAPAFDYAPDYDEGYYQPLDSGYYEPDQGGIGDIGLLALALALGGMLGQSPPDYGFDYYGGVQPWGWTTADRFVRYAEPVSGGYRYYYYEPDTYRPFFVQDPYYGYGYRDDRLVVIYDREGRRIDAQRAERQRLAARTFFVRGERLFQAGRDADRYGVPASLWERNRPTVVRDNSVWSSARSDRKVWRDWDRDEGVRLHRDWAEEAIMRRGAERSFDGWRQANYRPAAPAFYTPDARRAQLRKVADLRDAHRKVDRQRELKVQQAQMAPAVSTGKPQKVQQVAFAGQPERIAGAKRFSSAVGRDKQLSASSGKAQDRHLAPARVAVQPQPQTQPGKARDLRQPRIDTAVKQHKADTTRSESLRSQTVRADQQRQQQARAEQAKAQQARAKQSRQQQAARDQQRQQQQQAARAEQQRQQQAARAEQSRQQQAARAEQKRQQQAAVQAQAQAERQRQQQQAEAVRQQRQQAQAQSAQQPSAPADAGRSNGKPHGRGKA